MIPLAGCFVESEPPFARRDCPRPRWLLAWAGILALLGAWWCALGWALWRVM